MKKYGPWVSGGAAGIVNGLFGSGGGMILLPLLSATTDLRDQELFANCLAITLPMSLVSLTVYFLQGGSFAAEALPYLIGGAAGGVIAGLLLKKIKASWLRRAMGALIIWGGFRLMSS